MSFFFLNKKCQIFKNKKLITKLRKHSVDTCKLCKEDFAKCLVFFFCPKIFFTLVKIKIGTKNTLFGDFSAIKFLTKNLTI